MSLTWILTRQNRSSTANRIEMLGNTARNDFRAKAVKVILKTRKRILDGSKPL